MTTFQARLECLGKTDGLFMRTTILSSATTLMLCVLSVHSPLGCFYFFQGGLKNCFYSQFVWIADFLAVSSLYRVLNWRYMWGIEEVKRGHQFRTFAYGMVLTRHCKGGGRWRGLWDRSDTTASLAPRDSWGRARIDKQEQSKIDIICSFRNCCTGPILFLHFLTALRFDRVVERR